MTGSSGQSTETSAPVSKADRRRLAVEARAAERRRIEVRRRRVRRLAALAAVAAVATGGVLVARQAGAGSAPASSPTSPRVGGDLHTVEAIGGKLYVGGHEAVAVSGDAGRHWSDVPSLRGADAMGWAVVPGGVLVGGHPGLYRSADGGVTFSKATGAASVDDVHAIGSSGSTVYIASPQAGVLVSGDGGLHWQIRSATAGRSFMGTILVDPADPTRLIAPDMNGGLALSADGGRSWKSLGGPMGAMAAAWNPRNPKQIVAVGMSDAQMSSDGGVTWKQQAVPSGTSAVAFDPTGSVLYAGVLDGENARLYRSSDGGSTWTPTS